MKEILVISGKGGTGKTVITGALAALFKNKVLADCDVDAADLHLLLKPQVKKRNLFKSGVTAVISKEKCTLCGKCREICRFDAIDKNFKVTDFACEGCSFCYHVCPEGAIEMEENQTGEWFISNTRFGAMVHARLNIGAENSGKLVTVVKKEAKKLAEESGADWLLIDGSPGIGCPVIASLSGVDCAIIVTEPTLSGLHDAVRVITLGKYFNIKMNLVINKFDLNEKMSGKIADFCAHNNITLLGKLSFNKSIVKAMVKGKTIIEAADNKAKKEIKQIYHNLLKEGA